MLEFIDTHAHLDDEQFADDLPEVVARAQTAGIAAIVTVATSALSSAKTIALAGRFPNLFATVGIHPNHAAAAAPTDWDETVKLAQARRVVGIGETGLDRHWNDTPFPLQEEFFARHLGLARKHGLPVVIHCREAEADVLRMLQSEFERHGPIRGVMHSFTGTLATAQACLAMGLQISFAGMITYKNSANLRQVAAAIPFDRMLVETDSPYLAPVPVRGRRNEPAHVVHTAKCLAAEKNVAPEVIAEHTSRNARTLFGLVK